ncbi:MAG: VWA domain-containing protein [Acidobacteria bacterium]|nr:MAG: VWA domain-containing protein [Acidobacteriota bacterium]
MGTDPFSTGFQQVGDRSHAMRARVVVLVWPVLLALALAAPQQNPPVFRTTTNIVALDVTAVDKDGKPVKGLKASDFVVMLDGQQRPVQTVDYVEFGGGTAIAPATSTTPATLAAARAAATDRRVVVILFDDQSITPLTGRSLTAAANRTIDQFGPDDLIGVTSIGGMLPTVNPTTDRIALKAAILKMIGRAEVSPTPPFYISPLEAVEIDRGLTEDTLNRVAVRECELAGLGDKMIDACRAMISGLSRGYASDLRHRAAMQMDAYRQIIAVLKPFKGAKVVIALSGGVPTVADVGELPRQLEPIMREAAESGVRFYGMAEETDMTSMTAQSNEQDRARVTSDRAMFDGLATVASAAGGEAFHVIGQGDRFFTRIAAETSAIYRLGIDAPPNATSARYINAKVSVKRPGVTVRANRKALSASAAPVVVPIDDQLRTAVKYGGIDAAVPIRVASTVRRELAGAAVQIGVNVEMPADVAGPVTTMFSLVDVAGASVRAGRTTLAQPAAGQPYFFAFPLSVPSGKYTLRVATADATGRVGSAEQSIGAELQRLGNFTASQVLISWTSLSGERLLALDALPAGVKTLHAAIELYPDDAAAMATDIVVRFELSRIGETAALMSREIHPTATGTVLSATTDIEFGTLGAGSFAIRAIVAQSGVEKGTLTAVIRKASLQ